MKPDAHIPFIRILNAGDHEGEEIWAIAGIVRLLNVVRVWVYEVENILYEIEKSEGIPEDKLKILDESAHMLNRLLKQAYVVLINHGQKQDLAFLEEELFRFETMYIVSSVSLSITEKRIEFEHDRYQFLRHNLHAALHDLAQPVSIISSLVGMVRENLHGSKDEFVKDAYGVMEQAKSQLDRGFELVHGSFALEQISVSDLVTLTDETLKVLLKPEIITYQLENNFQEGRVLYSRMWFRGLLTNVVENAKKSFWIKGEQMGHGDFDRVIKLDFNQAEDSRGVALMQLIISDSGIGFSNDVLLEGFEQGKSEWDGGVLGSQGVGMATHMGFIKKLGGQVILRNINHNTLDASKEYTFTQLDKQSLKYLY